MTNTAIWDALGKTDPKHTKQFSRAGGFKGTALKPMWAIKRITEQFGPIGKGWGIDRPSFQVVPAGNETLVYCTVGCWVAGEPDPTGELPRFYGVGGDKVTTTRQSGAFNDDEAFKKAYTDAVLNAFKFLGVGADIHMGQFDDSKYVEQVRSEFAANDQPKRAEKWEGAYSGKSALHKGLIAVERNIRSCGDSNELEAYLASAEYKDFVASCDRYSPHYLSGGEPAPPEFVGIDELVAKMRNDFEMIENNPMRAG